MRSAKKILEEKSNLKKQAYDMIDACKNEIRSFTEEENENMIIIKQRIKELEDELAALEEKESNEEENEQREENSENDNVEEKSEDNDEGKESSDNHENDDEQNSEEENEEEERNSNISEKKNKKILYKMEKRFSILTAIRNISNNQPQDEVTSAVLAEGNNEMRKAGLNFVGQIQLPAEKRSLTVADEGEDIVATDFMDIVKPLQAKNVLVQAGAKYISGLKGDIQYPVMTKSACTWEGETASAKDGSPTFTNIKLSPKRLTTVVPISKQFLIQDSVGAENAIREEIINAINAKLESTILGDGVGTATEPAGMFNGALTSVSNFSGLCDIEAGLEEADVYGELKYIVAPKAKAALRNMAKSSKSTQLVWENDEVDGTTALCTSNVKDTNFVYGDFSQYVIAQWGNLDITVDNVTLADKGQIRLVVNAYFDAKPLREVAFAVGKIGA